MRKAVQELVEFMQDLDTEIMHTSNLGLEFEGMTLDYVILSENLQTRELSINFVNGDPDDKHSMWLNSEDVREDSQEWFDELCEQVVELE